MCTVTIIYTQCCGLRCRGTATYGLNLLSPFQSAYRKFHSTETALVKVHNDLISATDHGNLGALVALDFSSAFDTVNHQTFLSILQQRFGVADSALNWFQSYLSGRTHLSSGVSELLFSAESLKVPLSVQRSSLSIPKKLMKCFLPTNSAITVLLTTLRLILTSQVGAVALRIKDCLKDVADWCTWCAKTTTESWQDECHVVRLVYNASTTIAFYQRRR